jgi:hypothetical protein
MWRTTGASVTGTSHYSNQVPCQDSFSYKCLENRLLVAVSDGAGSAKFSDQGSKYIVDRLTELASQHENWGDFSAFENFTIDALDKIRSELVEKAKKEQCRLTDFAATVLFSFILPEVFFSFQIGDGAIVFQTEHESSVELAITPKSGCYVNDTVFLTSNDWENHLQFHHSTSKVNALVMLTDGLQHLAIKQSPYIHAFKPFFSPFFEFMKNQSDEDVRLMALTDFLNSDRVCEKTNDDKTLFLGVKCVQTETNYKK